jgi:hypothetical protein
MAQREPVTLRKGLGKDGNPNINYIRQHPTNYVWEPRVKRVAYQLVNMDRFYKRIWANTYFQHPPDWNRDDTSFDVWAYGGRGSFLSPTLRREVFDVIFNMDGAPDIWWIISGGGMWTRAGGWEDAPWGPADSDPGHWGHIHVTYLDLQAQIALNEALGR